MTSPRSLAAVWAARTAAFASRSLGRGGGTALGGLVGLRLQPHLIGELAAVLGQGTILVTGTNGKTTTSRLLTEAVRRAGLEPVANASGSNLVRGIASTLALAARDGDGTRRLGVLEVDEATVPLVLAETTPRAIVFLNLFRDQLDRYGEVEAVATLWRRCLAEAPQNICLVLDADDPMVASLGEGREHTVYFGVDDDRMAQEQVDHASDARSCLCGATLQYEAAYFGHVGRWRCPACGRARPQPDVSAADIDLRDGRSLSFTLRTGGNETRIEMSLGGLYNVYNAVAVAAAVQALSLPSSAAIEALTLTDAAFGRQEAFEIEGRRVELYLGKNPAGVNQVLATLALDPSRRTALILLNDGIADGRDISWVWDVDFERLASQFETVVVGGARAAEMALRLKYAEWDESTLHIEPDIGAALEQAIEVTPAGACLSVIPTYTAMLAVRDLLARSSGREPFWRSA